MADRAFQKGNLRRREHGIVDANHFDKSGLSLRLGGGVVILEEADDLVGTVEHGIARGVNKVPHFDAVYVAAHGIRRIIPRQHQPGQRIWRKQIGGERTV